MSKGNDIISATKAVISQYGGMKLTIRQIYYRLVAAQLIENRLSQYQYLVKLLAQARRDGVIPYTDIEDRTRQVHIPPKDETWMPGEKFNAYYNYMRDRMDKEYNLPRWTDQPVRPIVIVEKQALSSLFERVTDELGVDFIVNRGYPSLTLMYELSQRMMTKEDESRDGIEWKVIYFGDYDPSGIDIERNVGETLTDDFDMEFKIYRKAITRKQIEIYNIPPAPAKQTDSRYHSMLEQTGEVMQVELDAIEPHVLQDMIREAINEHFDLGVYSDVQELVEKRREMIRNWMSKAFNPDFKQPKNDADFDDEDEDDNDASEGGENA